MIRSYQFALDPTDDQVEQFRSHCGGARFVYNWGLALVLANWSQRAAEESYGIAAEDRTPWIGTSFDLINAWNAAKRDVAPWWSENSSRAYQKACQNLGRALTNWRTGRARMPRFKAKSRARLAFGLGAHVLLGSDRRHVRVPRIGAVRTLESTRKLARRVEAGTARIRSATVSFQRGRWFVSFSVDVPDPAAATGEVGRVVGVDLGIKHLAVLSTGEAVPNPRLLAQSQKALRRAQRTVSRRRGPDRSTRTEPSNRWRRARARVDKMHARVSNLRSVGIHRLTTRLVRDFDTVVIEDLHIVGMLRNRTLSRHIADASFGEIRRQLTYKCKWRGKRLIVADRWFASSKTCSGCGAAKAKLALSERTFVCMDCGLVLDRDVNAAKNLAALAADAGELRREQPDRTDVRPAQLAVLAVGSLRETSAEVTPHREVADR